MAILVKDLISEMEGLLNDEKKEYWKAPDYRKAINQAMRTAFSWLYTANEYIFLEALALTITSGDVTAMTRIFALASRVNYVSHFVNKIYLDSNSYFDFRPEWVGASGNTSRLDPLKDYLIGLPNIIFPAPFTETGTVNYWGKKFPTFVTQNTGTISMPEVVFDLLLELALFYAHRKGLENPEEQSNLIWHRDQVLQALKLQIGYPSGFKVDWNNLYDSGDL